MVIKTNTIFHETTKILNIIKANKYNNLDTKLARNKTRNKVTNSNAEVQNM